MCVLGPDLVGNGARVFGVLWVLRCIVCELRELFWSSVLIGYYCVLGVVEIVSYYGY